VDISSARTEAAASYKERQDEFDNEIWVTTTAHNVLSKLVEGDRGGLILGALYGDFAYKAGDIRKVKAPISAVRSSVEKGLIFSIAAIHSDFEWACRSLLTDALEFWPHCWSPSLGASAPPGAGSTPLGKRGWAGTVAEELRNQSAGSTFLESCYTLLTIRPHASDLALVPIFDLFRRIRNRVMHQDGIAGSELAEFSN